MNQIRRRIVLRGRRRGGHRDSMSRERSRMVWLLGSVAAAGAERRGERSVVWCGVVWRLAASCCTCMVRRVRCRCAVWWSAIVRAEQREAVVTRRGESSAARAAARTRSHHARPLLTLCSTACTSRQTQRPPPPLSLLRERSSALPSSPSLLSSPLPLLFSPRDE